jgi:hypothetical protein
MLLDLTGRRFGKLIVLSLAGRSSKHRTWLCKCDCGNTPPPVRSDNLRSGHTNSCGCLAHTFENLTGQTFSRLTVEGYAGSDEWGHSTWDCVCECGGKIVPTTSDLRSESVKSCGCLLEELGQQRHSGPTHGLSATSEYKAYHDARNRCFNKDHADYSDYGGRGIEFRFGSFEEFIHALGMKPSSDLSLDRYPDNDGHYEKGNVRWATKRQQRLNQRSMLAVAA